MSGKRRLPLVQVAVTGLLLWWVFSDATLRGQLAAVWRGADWRWLMLGVLLAGLDQLFNVVRWQLFLQGQGVRVRGWRVLEIFMAGVFFNAFLPGMVSGDALKVFWLAREQPGQSIAVAVSVIADRLIGLLALFAVTALVCLTRFEWLTQTPAATALNGFLLGFTGIAATVLAGSFVVTRHGWLDRLPSWLPRRAWFVRAGLGWQLLARQWRATLAAAALSVPVLLTYFAVFWCAARAFGAAVSAPDICAVMPVITVITSFPLFTGGLGAREKLFEQMLGDLAGTPAETAVSISLAGFGMYLVWSLVGAALFVAGRPAPRPPARSA